MTHQQPEIMKGQAIFGMPQMVSFGRPSSLPSDSRLDDKQTCNAKHFMFIFQHYLWDQIRFQNIIHECGSYISWLLNSCMNQCRLHLVNVNQASFVILHIMWQNNFVNLSVRRVRSQLKGSQNRKLALMIRNFVAEKS